ncbi:MAG: hypothetical protein AAF216_00925 [Pseudomonadota bacterium]
MNDVVVNLGVESPTDETALNRAIQLYTVWRQNLCDVENRVPDDDAPDIMVKTGLRPNGTVEKTLIFQERRWAAAFLRIWRSQRQLVH